MRPFHTQAAIALVALAALLAASPFELRHEWMQFRLQDGNNAVVGGGMQASWRIVTDGSFSSSPTFADGTIYAGNNSGELLAVDAPTGKIRWTYHVSNPLMAAPIVYGNVIIAGEGSEQSPNGSSPSHPVRVGEAPSALIGIDRAKGSVVWRDDIAGSGMPSGAVVDGVFVHHDGAGRLRGLDPASGRILYSEKLRAVASMTAVLPLGGDALVTSGVDPNEVLAVHAKDGTPIWRTAFSSVGSGLGDCPPAGDGARIYCNYVMPPSSTVPVQTERQAILRAYALDAKSGRKLWDVQLDRGILPKRNEAAIPLAAAGGVFMGSSIAPEMHALDPKTGALRWKLATHGAVKGGIVWVDGTLYFGDLGGYLWAVNAVSGRVVGSKKTGRPFNVGSPVVIGKTLVIGTRGGALLAMPLSAIRSAGDR